MPHPVPTSYDQVPYASVPAPAMHPDFLATRARLFGLTPPPVECCRVLELGCGLGNNLLPLALALPQARFLGVDQSATQIATARELSTRLGLDNLTWQSGDLLDLPPSAGPFDYILCHGVFSWVAEPVQEGILACCARHLSPNGVAFISYNTYPGWHLRHIVRDLLCHGDPSAASPQERIRNARNVLTAFAEAIPESTGAYRQLFQAEAALLARVPDAYLFHEHLERDNHPMTFTTFVTQAAAYGLNYLDDPDYSILYAQLPPRARTLLAQLATTRVEREQYLDWLCNRGFRQSLLCRADAPAAQTPDVEVVRSLWVRGQGRTESSPALLRAALGCLEEVWPRPVPFDTLHTLVKVRLLGCEAQQLAQTLLEAYLVRTVELHSVVPAFAAEPGERPVASPLARLQAAAGPAVMNLFHQLVTLPEFDRLVLCLLDGRDREALLDALDVLTRRGELQVHEEGRRLSDPARVRTGLQAMLEPALQRLARQALLRSPGTPGVS